MDDLEISGKLYISSKKAAKQNKYHVDYIGQLVRSGKIVGTKVGRAWYVEADSLAAYLGQEQESQSKSVHVQNVPELVKNVSIVSTPHALNALKEPAKQAEIAEETTDLRYVQAPPAFARRMGLTYLSDSEPMRKPVPLQPLQKTIQNKAAPEGFSVPIRLHAEPEPKNHLEARDQAEKAPQRRPNRTFLAFVGKLFFGVAAGGAFAALLGASYFLSYQTSVGGTGQAAEAVGAMTSSQ